MNLSRRVLPRASMPRAAPIATPPTARTTIGARQSGATMRNTTPRARRMPTANQNLPGPCQRCTNAITVRGITTPVRLEFPILSLNPGLRQRCVAPDVWGRRVAGGGHPDGRGACACRAREATSSSSALSRSCSWMMGSRSKMVRQLIGLASGLQATQAFLWLLRRRLRPVPPGEGRVSRPPTHRPRRETAST